MATVAQRQFESLKKQTLKQPNTSQKIRFLASKNKSVLEIEELLDQFGVRTKENNHIRYQHIRNVLMTKLVGDTEQ